MKKMLLAVSAAILVSHGMYAQITLSSSSYSSSFAGTTDTFLSSGTGVTYPSLVPATSMSWNMTSAVLTTPVGYDYSVAPDASVFTSAQFADSVVNSFATYDYIATFQRGITSGGFYEYGEHVNRQAIHITATGGPTDSMIFVAQDVIYSSPETIIKFPATYGSNWSSTYHLSFNFLLDVALLSYSNEPGSVKEYVSETDSVVGWGQMRVRTVSGGSSPYQLVLQVRRRIMQTDSFYVGGSLASSTLLSAFGVTQGQVTGQYEDAFYRPNEVYPLAAVGYRSDTFNTISGASTLAEGYGSDLSLGVNTIKNNNEASVYPNPVSNGTVNISVPNAQDGNWSYNIFNAAGNNVTNGSLNLSSNQTTTNISLGDALAPGVYYISISNNGAAIAVRPLEILK